MAEEARLESVYTPKAYRGFESPSLRKIVYKPLKNQWFFFYLYVLFTFLLSLRFLENHIKIRQRSSSLFFIKINVCETKPARNVFSVGCIAWYVALR